MAKYIDADLLRKEIEKYYDEYKAKFRTSGDGYFLGVADGLDVAEGVIDSLPEPQDKGCGIEFPHFGAKYPDAKCIKGYLWDMDSTDEDGLFTIGGDDPCPICNTQEWLKDVMNSEIFETEEEALAYVEKLRKKYLPNYDKPEPQSIDLEKEIETAWDKISCSVISFGDFADIVEHFYELGKGGK